LIYLGAVSSASLLFGQTGPSPSLTAIVSVPTATARIDPFNDPLIRQVQARQEKAVKGDSSETRSLTADLEKWTRQNPDNHLLQAYLGSVYTLDSRDAWPGPGKLTYLKNGGKELDDAVAAAPDNPAVRFVRAIDYYELPWFFGKRQTARDDFATLLKQVDGESQTPYTLSTETQQAICYYAGKSFCQLYPKSDLATKISAELGRLR
jgi:hypothetical protein